MFRYQKLNSKQAGSFTTPANRMIDIEIPEGMVCNLKDSFVQLLLHLEKESQAPENLCLVSTTDNLIPLNIDLIRNCSLVGSKVGRLEDLRRVNTLRHNMNLLTKSTEEKLSQIDSLYQMKDLYSQQLLSPFLDIYKEGNVASVNRDVYLRIPLSDLFELGSMEALDTSKTGKLILHLELENLSYLKFIQSDLITDIENETEMVDIDFGQPYDVLTTKVKYPNLQLSPFYVGANMSLSGAIDTTPETPIPAENEDVVITLITRNDDGTLNIQFQPSLPTIAEGQKWINLTLNEKAITNSEDAKLQVMTCELSLCEVVGKVETMNELEYYTWTTEEYTNGQKTLNKIFQVEPESVNAFLMFDTNSSNLISNNTGVKSYRMRLNNNDVYNRDILVNKETSKEKYIHDNLHYDSVLRTFLNANYPLKDMSFLGLKRDVDAIDTNSFVERFNQSDQQIMLCCAPVPLSNMPKQLQFNIVAEGMGATIDNVILYKQVVRSIKF